ncbi:MAG: 2-C-methyl-D-erythritol 4-phosphate cytidylyltransferase [Candidatus Marinimicrobia bacterium]|nr:2-C-methyl-D-erythritol 4-phosphate cytidylyltransferase [Candidatus Neomarinimicrobiota bacterium]
MSYASAIIVAAGIGVRMKSDTPKQYFLLNGRPLLYYTIKNFIKAKLVSEIVLVISKEFMDSELLKVCIPPGTSKPIKTVKGGKKRQDSVYNGLKSIDKYCDTVVVHDGVRPFIAPGKIDETIEMCNEYDGVVIATPAVDTMKEVNNSLIVKTLNRASIWQVQTPQTFRREVLERAFEKAYKNNFIGTDEASLVEHLGARIVVLKGDRRNIKVTCREDLKIASYLLKDCTV